MEKILLVADNHAASERIRNFIQKIDPGYEVIVFPMAGEAYSYACGEQVSLFILDIQLADYKGTNLARQLRALEAYKYTPILFETALAGEELTAYRDVQCYGFLINLLRKQNSGRHLTAPSAYPDSFAPPGRSFAFCKSSLF